MLSRQQSDKPASEMRTQQQDCYTSLSSHQVKEILVIIQNPML